MGKTITTIAKQCGQLLKRLRKDHGLTQVQLAEKLQMNYRHYQDVEAGKADIRLSTLDAILKQYHIDLLSALKVHGEADTRQQTPSTLSNLPIGVIEIDRSGQILFASKSFHRYFKRQHPELNGESLRSLISKEDRKVMLPGQIASDAPQIQDTLFLLDGQPVAVRIAWSPIRDRDGKIQAFSGTCYYRPHPALAAS